VQPRPRGPQPAVYARLREEAEVRLARRPPHPAARWAGWLLTAVIVVAVVLAVVWSSP
jgi:predicted anti-sigma-YlaC factor YlaD